MNALSPLPSQNQFHPYQPPTKIRPMVTLFSRFLLAMPLTIGVVTSAETDASLVWQEEAESYSWNLRLASGANPAIISGFSRQIQPINQGFWGSEYATFRSAGMSAASEAPGLGPVLGGTSFLAGASAGWAWGPFTISVRPEAMISSTGDGYQTIPNADPRELWVNNGEIQYQNRQRFEFVPRATVGLVGLGHALVASNEPIQWGEGIFGGIVLGKAWRGFPHIAIMPERSWNLGDVYEEPVYLRYEFIGGILDAYRRAGGPQRPQWTGGRLALRWWDTTASATVGVQTGGTGQRKSSLSEQLQLETWSEEKGKNNNRILSLGINQLIYSRISLSCEYGIDDWQPYFAEGPLGNFGTLNGFHPYSAAWTITLDAFDLTGDGKWRTALEWFRSEGYFYDHANYKSWNYDDGSLLAHADGGNANSLRFLLQHRGDDEQDTTLLMTWRRWGWRNARDNNVNTYLGRSGPGGSANVAQRPWDLYAAALNVKQPFIFRGRPFGNRTFGIGVELNDNYLFDEGRATWNGWMKIGWEGTW